MNNLLKSLPVIGKKFENDEVEENKNNKREVDKDFIARVQPQGGIKFEDLYIKKGDGYETCIHVYDYPKNVNEFWMQKIISMSDVNMMAITDIATMDRQESISAINKSMLEQRQRLLSEKQSIGQMDASNVHQELASLYQDISQLGEVIKLVNIRIWVHGKTAKDLEKNVVKVFAELDAQGFRGQCFINEQKFEYKSMLTPYSENKFYLNKRTGKGIPAMTLAAGLPFHYSDLYDPCGSYLGTTFTGGNVLFDLFHADKKRRFYNGVVVGTMGAGKSTLLKKLMADNALRGYFIRGFDVTGEFETLVKSLNGILLPLDGSRGLINPLQIFRTSNDNNISFIANEENSFKQHISKVTTFYQFLSPSSQANEVMEFKRMLTNMYRELGFNQKIKKGGVTNLDVKEYPIFSDLLNYVQNELYEDIETNKVKDSLTPTRVARLENIELVLESIVNSNGHLFNGHTTIPDLTHEKIVFYSIRSLTKFEKEIFNAQMFNALSLIWDNMIQVGAPQLKAMYEGNQFNFYDAIRFLVIIDEAHRVINPDNPLAVQFLTDFAREARKYFGGLIFASQSIRDFVPEGTSGDIMNKIITLFELTQYKFIMAQDSNALKTLQNVFSGQLSQSELEYIPLLQKGQSILSITGSQNMMMNIECSQKELDLFQGGI
ncbi:VirB4 family type IV secretion system protein [Heyndrickxia ginsengihumi]|uniref:VirB4 family type IV secretion system protein n=1 Tax=Heyndrickxia ginsengihumi TaxID=363870 RepID=UPI000472FAFE|nr:type IV secretion system VirB4 protein [Heyndrickxia ginsengihumi]